MARLEQGRTLKLLAAFAVLAAGCSGVTPPPSPAARVGTPPPSALPAAQTAAPSSTPSSSIGSCPVTLGNGQTPPGEAPSADYLGNGRLWTVLWPKGIAFVPPDDIEADGSLSMKFPWWRGPGVRGSLDISGHELRTGIPVRASIPDGYGDTGFQATGISFPVEGCYSVTGEVGGAELSFVTLVRTCAALVELPPVDREPYAICDNP